RDPAALGPAVVEVEHGCDGIHAQAVDTVAIEPEQPAREQEVRDFDPSIIVDEGVPIAVTALLRVFVLIHGGAVETGEPMRIVRKKPGNPIENDAQPFAVTGINQSGKIRRRAETTAVSI